MGKSRKRREHPAHEDKPRWSRLRRRIFERDGWRCRQCGKAGGLECDHIVRVEDGGAKWDPANLQSLCYGCHKAKSDGEQEAPDPERDAWRRLIDERMSSP